jgi:uncharacterized protein YggT (Ycf19 family)
MMLAVLVEALNWFLAFLMWTIIGQLVLELITGGQRTIISEAFRRVTAPVFWLVRQATPPFIGDRFIPVFTLALVIVLRLAVGLLLLPAVAPRA